MNAHKIINDDADTALGAPLNSALDTRATSLPTDASILEQGAVAGDTPFY